MTANQSAERRVNILIVDDEESILQLYANILKPDQVFANFRLEKSFFPSTPLKGGNLVDLTLCKNAGEAIDTFEKTGQNHFSLVFLDVHLGAGEENGICLAEKIRAKDNHVEIVLVTGDAQIDMTEIAEKIPPNDKLFYLSKPFKTMEIRQFAESLSAKALSEKLLKEMQANLENLVQDRTHELLESNSKLVSEIKQREKAECSLRQSEENFKKMIEENADAIMIVDSCAKIRFVNPAAEQLFHVFKNKLIDRRFEYPLVVGDRSEIILGGDSTEKVTCEMRVVNTEWQGETAYLASLRDITERKELEENLWKSLEQNQLVMKGTIQVIARLLEMKDPYTAGHQKRVSELAQGIAAAIGLDEREQEGIRMASLIHDIGKISIPSEILSKPGKLSDIEYDLIKTHAQTGFDILKEIEFPWPVAQMVLQHHEKMDGSGYPNGIRGDEIILSSRILTVADVMEAISSHRPYRAALGIDKGIEHIRQYAGRYYDPHIVDACVSLFYEQHFEFRTKGLQAREYAEAIPVPRAV